MRERRHDIDWLRVIIILLVLIFHTALMFTNVGFHLNNEDKSFSLMILAGWLDSWFMPLFFLIAGFSNYFNLNKRSIRDYIINRTYRILIPVYITGLFFILFSVFYFEAYTYYNFRGSLIDLIPIYFERFRIFNVASPAGLIPLPYPSHMWFLQFLILISIISIPLIKVAESKIGKKVIQFITNGKRIYIFLVPLFIIRVTLRSFFEGEHNWADFVEFVIYYLIGYIFASNPSFKKRIEQKSISHLILGLLAFGFGHGLIMQLWGYNYPSGEGFSLKYVSFQFFFTICRYSWILFMLSIASKYLNFTNKILMYCKEAVFPFYIIHKTVMLSIAWFILSLSLGVFTKFISIIILSLVGIMLIYEFIIRRFNVLRILCGMGKK